MASTTLFAPQVRAVQPAFTYDLSSGVGTVRIYFTLSYNTIDDINGIRYSLIDPNKSFLDGVNSMIKSYIKTSDTSKMSGKTYYIENEGVYTAFTGDVFISGTDYYEQIKDKYAYPSYTLDSTKTEQSFDIIFNNTDFEELTVNRFYQLQIELKDASGNWSLPSTVSLVRPIAPIAAGAVVVQGQKLIGSISYTGDSTVETIVSYVYNIKQGGTEVYSTPTKIMNFKGLSFEANIPYMFEEGKTYQVNVFYTTKHGYTNTSALSYTKTVATLTDVIDLGRIKDQYPKVNLEEGSLDWRFDSIQDGAILQRAVESSGYKIWEDVATVPTGTKAVKDILVPGKEKCKYRLVDSAKEKQQLLKWKANESDVYEIEMHYDDIFISDKDYMFALRYNPKISSLKWVTQDSITNTLGSKYPLVRRNGDQFYRQFGISGTLYLDWPEGVTGTDSVLVEGQPHNMSDFFVEEGCSLYLNNANANKYTKNLLKKQMRNIIAEFLSNGQVKLIRSEEEGLMLVYLSGVSFTPNATSGRRIYDFSATATEVCEATAENIARYIPSQAAVYYINASKISN